MSNHSCVVMGNETRLTQCADGPLKDNNPTVAQRWATRTKQQPHN